MGTPQAVSHPGRSLGTATQIGISLGGRWRTASRALVVDLQPVATSCSTRRALGSSEAPDSAAGLMHQSRLLTTTGTSDPHGKLRGTPLERAHIGWTGRPGAGLRGDGQVDGWYAEALSTSLRKFLPRCSARSSGQAGSRPSRHHHPKR